MLSLNSESLFPSIPFKKTIGIATEYYFKNSEINFNNSQILKLFQVCTKISRLYSKYFLKTNKSCCNKISIYSRFSISISYNN